MVRGALSGEHTSFGRLARSVADARAASALARALAQSMIDIEG
jgi:hypothetical protein